MAEKTKLWKKCEGRLLAAVMGAVYSFIAPLSFQAPALADEIFKSVDEKGNIKYSTTSSAPGAKKKELPPLMKENWDKRISKIKEATPENCSSHGEVDCAKGADSDGSVICLDGYRDAILPFRFQCMEARLKFDHPSYTGEKGEIVKLSDPEWPSYPKKLSVNVRNLSPVKAFGIRGELVLRKRTIAPLIGPGEIEPYGFAEFEGTLVSPGPPKEQLKKARLKLQCVNCSLVSSSPAVE